MRMYNSQPYRLAWSVLAAHINLQYIDSVHKISGIEKFAHMNVLKVFLSFNSEFCRIKNYVTLLFFTTI